MEQVAEEKQEIVTIAEYREKKMFDEEEHRIYSFEKEYIKKIMVQ